MELTCFGCAQTNLHHRPSPDIRRIREPDKGPKEGLVMACIPGMRARLWARAAAVTVALLAAAPSVRAQSDFPSRPVRIIVPYGPGGVADVTMRLVAQKMSDSMGQQFVIDNRPGAAGIVGAQGAVSAAPDGHTLLLTGNGTAISKSLFKSLPYDVLRDFSSIALLAQFDMLLATKTGSQIDAFPKLMAYARANPGKLNFGTIASGSTQHLSAELFKLLTGVEAALVTYRTTPELVTAILRGDVDVGFDYYAAFRSAILEKQMTIVATAGDHPSPQLPGVPTVKDSGFPAYLVTSWNALSGPAGIPAPVVDKLNREVNAALKLPDVKERVAQFGMEAMGGTPEQMTGRMKSEIDKWAGVIEKAGVPKQ